MTKGFKNQKDPVPVPVPVTKNKGGSRIPKIKSVTIENVFCRL